MIFLLQFTHNYDYYYCNNPVPDDFLLKLLQLIKLLLPLLARVDLLLLLLMHTIY